MKEQGLTRSVSVRPSVRSIPRCDLKPLFRLFFLFMQVKVQWNPALRRLIRTPALNGHFRLSRQKAHIFSLKLTRFIRTPVNTDNGHFCVSRVTNSHILSTRFTDTGYLYTVYFHCHNYVIIVDIVPCSNNGRFLRVNKILLQY